MSSQERYVGRESGLHLVESVHAYVGAIPPTQAVDEPSLAEKLWSAEHDRLGFKLAPVPPPDLARLLIDAFFEHLGQLCPFVHRPYFEECIANGLFETDATFRGMCAWSFPACVLLAQNERWARADLSCARRQTTPRARSEPASSTTRASMTPR